MQCITQPSRGNPFSHSFSLLFARAFPSPLKKGETAQRLIKLSGAS
ncbi:MAG: hypothetical protein QOH25_1469 [Acidobacteriota bacterium]|jgi:hypothetical protein|nr:hypothetical protein [Acidobacteriota bacterium]